MKMSFRRIGLPTIAVIALSCAPVLAADLETQVVDKNCWIEVFEDDNYDMDDPHVKLQGPKEFATLKNLAGKDWSNDIERDIFGSNAKEKAYKDKDFKGTELACSQGQRVHNHGKLVLAKHIES